MKKMIFSTLILMVSLMIVASSHADIYMYVDENGQKRWTDDMSQVPVPQREAVTSAPSLPDTDPTTFPGVSDREPPRRDSDVSPEPKPSDTEAEAAERNSLETEKKELDRIYKELAVERDELQRMSGEPLNSSDRTALNAQIKAFNEKTGEYETRISQFNEKINVYNQKLMPTRPSNDPEDKKEETP